VRLPRRCELERHAAKTRTVALEAPLVLSALQEYVSVAIS
jgi:hypothetical protein